MSIHYLLDGYNIIHQMPALTLKKLEEQRNHLIRFIDNRRPQGSLNNKVTVVFDGSESVFGTMTSATAKILFSQGESADEQIKRIVAEADNSKSMVVVTDDRDIQYAVRALGAKVCGVREFLSKKQETSASSKRVHKSTGKKTGQPSSEKYISKSDEFQITSELEQFWLKPDADE